VTITIRPEGADEAAAVRAVNDAAFGTTHEGQIVDDLRGTDRWIDGGSLVAADDETEELVGHLLISEGDLDLDQGGTRRVWMIGPVAVVPQRQRQGIGGKLLAAAAGLATERGQPLLILLGHADYYPRFGYEPARAIGIEAPRPWSDANWFALRLPAWDASLRGVARFPEAFPDSQ
jgi:putative acetyltransferase